MAKTLKAKHTIRRLVDGKFRDHAPGTVFPCSDEAEAKFLIESGAAVVAERSTGQPPEMVAPYGKQIESAAGTDTEGMSKDALIARAKELNVSGVKKNSTVPWLKAEIAKAEAALADDESDDDSDDGDDGDDGDDDSDDDIM